MPRQPLSLHAIAVRVQRMRISNSFSEGEIQALESSVGTVDSPRDEEAAVSAGATSSDDLKTAI